MRCGGWESFGKFGLGLNIYDGISHETYLELPNILWPRFCVYCPFRRRESVRRRVNAAETSLIVSVLFGPDAEARSSSMRSCAGTP